MKNPFCGQLSKNIAGMAVLRAGLLVTKRWHVSPLKNCPREILVLAEVCPVGVRPNFIIVSLHIHTEVADVKTPKPKNRPDCLNHT